MEFGFEDKYNIFSFNTDPTFMGHCTNRRRKFTWCIRKDLEFTCSEHEFMVMFDPYTVANGSIFYCAPEGYLQTSLYLLCPSVILVFTPVSNIDPTSKDP